MTLIHVFINLLAKDHLLLHTLLKSSGEIIFLIMLNNLWLALVHHINLFTSYVLDKVMNKSSIHFTESGNI